MIGCVDIKGLGVVAAALGSQSGDVRHFVDSDAAIDAVAKRAVDVMIVESRGLEAPVPRILATARAAAVPTLLVGRDSSVATAIDALHLGATDYLSAPFELDSFQRARDRLLDATFAATAEVPFATQDPDTLSTLELVRSIATNDATVLIEGESGTGKELLAQLVHRASPRGHRELVSVNCAALPEGLLESELFGHERGAFTGALSRSIGKFELAHGTTILLDEIGELALGLQAKLLRVLQERQVQRVGARRPVEVDFRLVATTNRDLRAEVAAGRFREDLYYRLNVLPVRLKPLRERPGDVQLLVEHFAEDNARRGQPRPVFTPEALAALEAHDWPGNARELENLVERLALTSGGRPIEASELGFGADPEVKPDAKAEQQVPPFRSIREMERWLIVETLKLRCGNRTQAAKDLQISLRTLRNKIREYDVNEPETLPRTGLSRAQRSAPTAGQNSPTHV